MLLSESQFVKGACQCMCPAKERNLRSKERMIHILETNLDLQTFRQTKNIPADSNRMVKKFSRSAAGQELSHPELLRPPEVLLRTVNYLLSELSGSPPAEFDSHLNYNHLNECLKRLLTCYDELNTESAERDEMEAVFLLLNPGHSEPLLRYLSLKKDLFFFVPHFRGKLANAGFRISKAWLASNFAKCSREIRKSVTPILACTISRSLPILRRNILKIMSAGYSSKNQCYPVSKLVQFLLCNDATEAFSYCQFYNIECQKSSSAVRFERGSFDHQKSEMNLSNWVLAEEKLSAFSVPDILLGHTYTHDEGKGWQQDLHKNVEKISNMKLGDKEAEFPPKVPNFNPSIPFFSQDNIACVTSHLQTIRDHLCAFQERQGIPREENNFFGLALIIIQQSGQAMYAVFMLFLALFPVATIFLAILHFIVDRLIDILCTKTPADIYFKLGVLCAQLLLIYLMTQFVVYTIFSPIFTMQLNIISKMIMISRGNLVLK
ncbi:unnamed protein product [Bemisia tabaci]|uniref:SAC3/GANP/THP3 conserved domain-containing protein n=1 Tax=Bemisia tabaci TaxID=7038 RepID=A0A9P0A9V3_BEMTA|nr:unnamed protein product [Bemisia tabaci]